MYGAKSERGRRMSRSSNLDRAATWTNYYINKSFSTGTNPQEVTSSEKVRIEILERP
jgi:hypothetical protein